MHPASSVGGDAYINEDRHTINIGIDVDAPDLGEGQRAHVYYLIEEIVDSDKNDNEFR